jgi:predicted NBD/HSP70 family sugar kinase
MAHVWGIDLGGTKIEGVVLDPAAPERPLCRLRLPTEAENGYAHIRSQIVLLCQKMAGEAGTSLPKKIGIGTPGVIDPPTGLLKNSNTQCLNGQPLGRDLAADLGTEPILANDANCLTLAEATLGAGRGYPTVFGIILGTGVGGGIVIDGKIVAGCHGIAGEWGQLVLDPNGPPSAYGTRGTIEAFIAGPALECFYAEQSGRRRPLKEIAARAGTGDVPAAQTIDRLTTYFAKAIASVVDILDPHALIIGGGVGNIDALYSEETRVKIAEEIFNPRFEAALLKPALGDSGGVFGAAMLVA